MKKTNSKSIIELKDITKMYPTVKGNLMILKGVNLKISDGLTLIMGPSGSGKTTLLNLLGGLDSPTSGSIFYGQTDLIKQKSKNREKFRLNSVGFVFQFHNLALHLNSLQNVMIPALLANTSYKKSKLKAIELLTSLGLETRLEHKVYQLSAGESQRVAFATSLINDPNLLLCDEPTGNLDLQTTEKLIEFIQDHIKIISSKIVVVSHDPIFKNIADNIWNLDNGLLSKDF